MSPTSHPTIVSKIQCYKFGVESADIKFGVMRRTSFRLPGGKTLTLSTKTRILKEILEWLYVTKYVASELATFGPPIVTAEL